MKENEKKKKLREPQKQNQTLMMLKCFLCACVRYIIIIIERIIEFNEPSRTPTFQTRKQRFLKSLKFKTYELKHKN